MKLHDAGCESPCHGMRVLLSTMLTLRAASYAVGKLRSVDSQRPSCSGDTHGRGRPCHLLRLLSPKVRDPADAMETRGAFGEDGGGPMTIIRRHRNLIRKAWEAG